MVSPVTDWIEHRRQTKPGSNVAFLLLVSMVIISGFADGLVGGSLVGATGELPGRYMQAVFAGSATAGILLVFHYYSLHPKIIVIQNIVYKSIMILGLPLTNYLLF